MKKQLFFIIMVLLCKASLAQKPSITDTTYKTWTEVSNGSLSNDGKYAMYTIQNKPVGGNTLVVTKTDKSWEIESTVLSNPVFSEDSKYLFALENNNLIKQKLGSKERITIPHCTGYELYSSVHNNWLIYQLDTLNTLKIQNLKNGHEITLPDASGYILNKEAESIIWKSQGNNTSIETLHILNLASEKSKVIYEGFPTSDFIFDQFGHKIAFIAIKADVKQIWYYDETLPSSELIINTSTKGIKESHQIATDAVWGFSTDGTELFFTQSPNFDQSPDSKNPKIWNYQDAFLLSNYLGSKFGVLSGINLSTVNIKNKSIRQLLSGQQKLKNPFSSLQNTDILVVESVFGREDEEQWNVYAKPSYYLCFTKTGRLQPFVKSDNSTINEIQFSPDNKYLLYFDSALKNYISYNVQSQETKVVGKSVEDELCTYSTDRNLKNSNPGGIQGWITGTHQVIIQGKFDLWALDIDLNTPPINLTKGEGKRAKIIFSLLSDKYHPLDTKTIYWVQGFDLNTKGCHLYQLNLATGDFSKKYTCNKAFDWAYVNGSTFFQKSKNGNGYLLFFGGAGPWNYYYTSNFIKITDISNNHPEKPYNWIKSELLTYKDSLGNDCDGILYKPDNFDPQKKYPVIFHYYLGMSHELNRSKSPDPSNIGFNISLLVSQGYLVCEPDIYRIFRKPGDAALVSVLAAANYLSKFNWVDSAKMGIIGHSLGGFETNYIITHSNKFRAAIAIAAPSSIVDLYNETFGNGFSAQSYVEKRVLLMGKGLAEIPNNYIDNSPIFNAKNINTPLLLMHNNGDKAVPVEHSKKMIIQMRTLQKPVWLVQYDKEDHTLSDVNDQLDFQQKLQQFFDFFLRDKNIPSWMTQNIKPVF